MDSHARQVMQECTQGADEGRLSFPQVVMKLMEIGVERYHADLCRAEKTYYLPNGASYMVASAVIGQHAAEEFVAGDIEIAIYAVQAGKVTYKEFCILIAIAGCVGYIVSLVGRRTLYFGRTGHSHIDVFIPASR